MTAAPAPVSTHAVTIMEMLSVAARTGAPWIHVEDIADRLYPAGRPLAYAASIRSTINEIRVPLAEVGETVACRDRRYALTLSLPGVFRAGAGFVEVTPLRGRVQAGMRARFAPGVARRAGR